MNQVTPALFARYPDAAALAAADPAELEELIRPTGFFRAKAKNLRACAAALVERHGGEVPEALDDLTALPGVGRKTANCVRGDAFGLPGITVDTHVGRLARRLGLTKHDDPVKAEFALMKLLPEASWTRGSHQIILHGRRVCHARRPLCSDCTLAAFCPQIGVLKSSSPQGASRKPSPRPGRSGRPDDLKT